jgi:hypothetical protein
MKELAMMHTHPVEQAALAWLDANLARRDASRRPRVRTVSAASRCMWSRL